jgi:hypothetical protein
MDFQKYEMPTKGISLAFLLSGAGTAWEYHDIDIIRMVVFNALAGLEKCTVN